MSQTLREREQEIDNLFITDILNMVEESIPLMEKDFDEVGIFKTKYEFTKSQWKKSKEIINEDRKTVLKFLMFFTYSIVFGLAMFSIWVFFHFIL